MSNKSIITGAIFFLSCLMPTIAAAEVVPGTSLSVNFESANVVGTGRNINMRRVPVTDIDTGNTTFHDASFRFTFSPGAGFTFEQIQSVAISPPVAEAANIIPGIYRTQAGTCYILEGPTILNVNRSLYTIRGVNSTSSLGCNDALDQFAAQIVSGTATDHPDIGNREIAPNLPNTYVYGFISADASFGQIIGLEWDQNELIGLRQSGNQLIIGLFSEGEDINGNIIDFIDPRITAILTNVIE